MSRAKLREREVRSRRTDEPDGQERIVLIVLSRVPCRIRTALFLLLLSRRRELILPFLPPRLPTLLALVGLLSTFLPCSHARLAALLLHTFPVNFFPYLQLPSRKSLGVRRDDRRRRKKRVVRAAEGGQQGVSSGRRCGGDEAGVGTCKDRREYLR